MSQQIVWGITRNNHCYFLKSRKNGGVQFDKNPANLKNKNTLKFSGFANSKTVNIQAGKGNKGVVMKLGNQAPMEWQSHKGQRTIVVKAGNAVAKFNPNLRGVAQKRLSAIIRSQKS